MEASTWGIDTIEAHGTFNGWGALYLVQVGSSTVYTNTATDTTDTNGGCMQYKYVVDGYYYESPAYGGNNRLASLPLISGASLVLPTPFFNDDGAPVANAIKFQVNLAQQINLGAFIPGTSTVYVRGTWQSGGGFDLSSPLTNDPSILTTNQFGLVNSNVYVGTYDVVDSPGASEDMKYYIDTGDNWETPAPANQDPNNNNNRYLPECCADTAGHRLYFAGDQPFAPLCSVTFSVDMSAQAYYGNWNSSEPVGLGDIGGVMTNNPNASNTNIYYETLVLGQGSFEKYKFYYNNGGQVYETLNPPTAPPYADRFITVPTVASTNLPTVFFSDIAIDDLLTTERTPW